MADKKISELVSADALSGAELIETVQGGVNKRTTAQDIANLADTGGGTWGSITGTLSDQTDLQGALDGKAASSHSHAISDVTNLQTSLDAKMNALVSTNRQTSSYQLVIGDAGKLVELNNASPVDLTVPANDDVAFPVGTQLLVAQYGNGQVTIEPGAGVDIFSASGYRLRARYSQASLIKISTNEWYLAGDLIP